MYKKIAIIIALIMAFAMVPTAGFTLEKSLDDSLDEIEQEIKDKQAELEEGKDKEKSLSSKVVELEEMIVDLDERIDAGEVQLAELEEDLAKAQKRVDKQNDELSVRLRTMYKNGSVGFLDVVMNSGSFSEFLTNMDLVQKIFASDQDVLKDLQEAHDEIEKKKEKIESLQYSLESSKNTAEVEKKEVQSQKEKIAKDNDETAKMLDDLEEEAAAVQAQLAAQSQEGTISNSSTSEYTGGVLLWPTPGYTEITSGYGWRICPFHGKEFHGAIDIGADGGASIIASAAGTVISAGYNGGFGNSVQIDHGGGLVTMYNHCSALYVSKGDTVEKGQSIAAVGSTGSSTGNHLDFRVFKDGSTANPLGYLQ